MSRSLSRYELLLPRRFNDQQPVPEDLFVDCLLELRQRFGAASSETQTIRGFWTSQGQEFVDDLIRIFVDVPDTPENRQFFVEFKERLKSRFNQLEIWITSHVVDVI
jgi:hypothetical protein